MFDLDLIWNIFEQTVAMSPHATPESEMATPQGAEPGESGAESGETRDDAPQRFRVLFPSFHRTFRRKDLKASGLATPPFNAAPSRGD